MNKHLLSLAISTAILSHGVLAEEIETQQKEKELEMLSVVGQATGGVDSVIDREQLDITQATDLNDIFALNAEVSVGGGVALGQKLYVRNIGEDMLNITVDGASQAGGVFHHAGRIVIEPDLLQQIEVEAGAGSATAGLGALGGAVRFVTKDPEDLLRSNETVGATIKSTYYSNGESLKNSATVYAADEKGTIGGLLNIVSADFNNRKDGDGDEIVGSETENLVGFAKLVANINEEQKLSLSYESLKQEGDILYRPEWIPSAKNPITATEANRETIIANYNLNTSSDLVNISINAYQTIVEQLRGDNGEVDGGVETLGLTIENTSVIGSNKLIYGINYQDDSASLTESGTKLGEETGEILGFFVQDTIHVDNQLTVTTGLRFDDYSLKDINGNDISDSGLSPNLSANYAFTPELSMSAGYAEAIRGATIADAYVMYAGSYTNDPDLKAERAKNLEVAAEYNAGSVSAAIGLYTTTIEDPIGESYPEIWSGHYENGDDIETDGFFLKAGYQYEGLNAMASFHSADTEQNGLPVTRYQHASSATSIGDTLVVDVNYQFNSAWFMGWTGQVVSDQGSATYNYSYAGAPQGPVTIEQKGYSTHDLYVRWSPMVDDTLVMNLTIKNVFDETYLNQASPEDLTANVGYEIVSGQNDPGRDIRFSTAIKF